MMSYSNRIYRRALVVCLDLRQRHHAITDVVVLFLLGSETCPELLIKHVKKLAPIPPLADLHKLHPPSDQVKAGKG